MAGQGQKGGGQVQQPFQIQSDPNKISEAIANMQGDAAPKLTRQELSGVTSTGTIPNFDLSQRRGTATNNRRPMSNNQPIIEFQSSGDALGTTFDDSTTPMPMQPQSGFNVNQAASTGLQGALGATQAAVAAPLNVGAYMNPYTQNVIDTTQADIERQRQMAINNMGAAATRANAFGGSRQGVAEGVTNAEFGRVAGNLIAPMRRDAFNTAMNNAMTDRSQRLDAANQLGGLANQAFNTGRTINQDMMQQGLLQQMLQQQLIDAARSDFAGYANSPMQSLSPTIAALGAAPVPQSSTTRQNPGILGILGGLLPFF